MELKLTGSRCKCNACGLYFNSTAAFDFHRDGPWSARRCMTAHELRAEGYEPNAAGFWRQPAPAGMFNKFTREAA
jgi:hypothetical protein